MRKLVTIMLILALAVPAAVAAENDPIVGGWYIMLDYNDMPYDDTLADGKNYMIYMLFFEESGTISGFSGESIQGAGFYGYGSTLGTWLKNGDGYTVNIIGIGISNSTIENDRLILFASDNIYYSMRRLDWGSWENDLIRKY